MGKELKTRKVFLGQGTVSVYANRYLALYPVYSTRECERRKRQIARGIIRVSKEGQ